jgi:hypothetical protein
VLDVISHVDCPVDYQLSTVDNTPTTCLLSTVSYCRLLSTINYHQLDITHSIFDGVDSSTALLQSQPKAVPRLSLSNLHTMEGVDLTKAMLNKGKQMASVAASAANGNGGKKRRKGTDLKPIVTNEGTPTESYVMFS